MTNGGKIHRVHTYTENDGILTVGELTARVKQTLQGLFGNVWVEGEVSNARRHSSGHTYFTLKDASSQLRCVLWRSTALRVDVRPTDGMLLHVRGYVSVYEARGEYQLVVQQIRPAGEGALQKAFEALKRSLAAEGLFDSERKRPLPRFPKTIGLVTSADGAAKRDITSILARRYPLVRVVLAPVAVQGSPAAGQIAAAIRAFDRAARRGLREVDVLIVGRGGGSAEDLWPFNEEVVARAIFDCSIPVVSAVGHETDFSISDFVADVRAATPSMAAELVVPDGIELGRQVERRIDRARVRVREIVERERRRIRALVRSHGFNQPSSRLREHQQRTDDLESRLFRATVHLLAHRKLVVEGTENKLKALNPQGPLERGFALVERSGVRTRRAAELSSGDRVVLQFADDKKGAKIV
jgi:exodeoxyribonuclease VII large subunit